MGKPLSKILCSCVVRPVASGRTRRKAAAQFGVSAASAVRWIEAVCAATIWMVDVLPHPGMLPSRGSVASPECSPSTTATSGDNTRGSANEFWPRVLTDFGPPSVPQPTVTLVVPGGSAWIGKPKWNCSSSFVRSMSLGSARLPALRRNSACIGGWCVRQSPVRCRHSTAIRRGPGRDWTQSRPSSTQCWRRIGEHHASSGTRRGASTGGS